MKLIATALASAAVLLFSVPVFADTLTGKIVYKNSEGQIVTKMGSVELTPSRIDAIKLKIEGDETVAHQVKVKVMDTENRKIVLAAFRGVRDMPEGVTLVVKGSLIQGVNGNVFYGDLFTRSCQTHGSQDDGEQDGDQGKTSIADVDGNAANDDENTFLQRLLDRIEAAQDFTGCSSEYRGGLVVARQLDGEQDQ
jgi:hypothetical protein